MASGTLTFASFVISEESLALDQLVDVEAATSGSGDTIVYKDSAVDTSNATE